MKIGDRVIVKRPQSPFHGEKGTIIDGFNVTRVNAVFTKVGRRWDVKFDNGNVPGMFCEEYLRTVRD